MTKERRKLDDVVDELNRTWSDKLGTHLDLITWERDVCPGVGEDPQDVINKQIDNYNYDIFIGIIWKRLGTATTRADSGTVEEYERAYERYRKDSNQIKIMFYFKKILPSERSEIDVDELDKINKFKAKLRLHNLCCIYEDIDEFGKLIQRHLSKQMQGWQKSWGKKPAKLKFRYENPTGWVKRDPDVGDNVNSTTILTDDRAEIRIDIIRLSNSELDQIAKMQFVEDDSDLDGEAPSWITAYNEDPWGIAKGLWITYVNYLNKFNLKPRNISGRGTGLLSPDGACAFYATNDRHDGPPPDLPLEWYFVWIRPEYGNVFVGIHARFPPNYLEIYDTLKYSLWWS